MRIITKKRIGVLICIFLIVFSSYLNMANRSTIILTLTETFFEWHAEQPSVVTTQRVGVGDVVNLGWNGSGWNITIAEIRNSSIVLLIEPDEELENYIPHEFVEIAFGEEFLISTTTFSTWTDWILLFSNN